MREMMNAQDVMRAQSGGLPAELSLIRAARAGDVGAFEEIFHLYRGRVYLLALRMLGRREDAEDVVQETFVRAWAGMRSFRGDSRLLTWLCAIASRLCIDTLRQRGRNAALNADPLCDVAAASAPEAHSAELSQTLQDALARLCPAHRLLVVLCDIQGLTSAEAARVAGCSPLSVRVRLCRARRVLRRMLAPYLGQEVLK